MSRTPVDNVAPANERHDGDYSARMRHAMKRPDDLTKPPPELRRRLRHVAPRRGRHQRGHSLLRRTERDRIVRHPPRPALIRPFGDVQRHTAQRTTVLRSQITILAPDALGQRRRDTNGLDDERVNTQHEALLRLSSLLSREA